MKPELLIEKEQLKYLLAEVEKAPVNSKKLAKFDIWVLWQFSFTLIIYCHRQPETVKTKKFYKPTVEACREAVAKKTAEYEKFAK